MGYAKDKQFEEIISKIQELKNGCGDEEKRREFFNLLLSISADTRKEYLKVYNEICEEANKEISKTKEQIHKLKKAIKITKKSLNKITDNEEKEKSKKELDKIEEALKETQQSVKETVKEIKTKLRKIKQYKIVKAHSLNNKINWLTGIFLVLSIVLVGFIQAFYWLRIVYAICIGLVSVFLLGWKIYFIHKYISSKMSDIPSKIIVYLSKLSTTTLIIWGFLNITIFAFTSNFPDFIGWLLIAIIFVKVVILLYDFFCTSGFYKDLQENIIWLYVSIILVISLFSPLIKNEVVFGFYKGFLIGISLLLTALVLKRLLLDIKNLKGYSEVLYLIIICALTIFLTVYAIYTCCWVVDSQSQPLFSAITGIYAALIGGALTLGGVAWTIKKADNDRKEENRGKARPFFGIIDTDNYKSEVSQRLEIGFRPKEFNKLNYYKEINIENSDKVPFFIEKFVIGEREYYPDSTLLISKGMMCALVIYEEDDKKTNTNKFYLYLTDINYEQRKYEIEDLGYYRYTIKEI